MWVALFAVAFGTNVPTPLLLVYRERLDLSPAVLTAVFGVYAAGLTPSLLVAGSLSDRLGRRRVVLPFVLLAAGTSGLFLAAADSVALLFVCRFLQGVVSGVVFSVGGAWLVELSGASSAGTAARRASVAMTAGFSLGPFTSGIVAQLAPAPTRTPYLVHIGLMVVGIAAALRVPETDSVRRGGPLVRLALPAGARRAFWLLLAPAAVPVFAFAALATSLLPLPLAREMGGGALVVTAFVCLLTLGSGLLVQPVILRVPARRAAPTGAAVGAAGLALAAVATGTGAWPLLLPTAVLLGVGSGYCLTAGLTLVRELADPDSLGGLTSAYYAMAYLGFWVPLGTATTVGWLGYARPLAALAALSAVLSLHLATVGARQRRTA